MDKVYNPGFEKRIYDFWVKNRYFEAHPNSEKEPFTIMMPPPNITGQLHMGHALNQTIQDIIIRFKRMDGYVNCYRGQDSRANEKRGAHQK